MRRSEVARRPLRLLPASIQARLLLLLAVTLGPMLGVLGIVYTQRYRESREQEFRANLEVARAVGRAFDAFVDGVSWHESALGSALTALKPFSTERANGLLTASARGYPAVEHLHWLSPRGRVLASSDPGAVGADMNERRAQFHPVRAGETYVSDLYRIGGTGEWRFAIRRGIVGQRGELVGVMSARVVPQSLGDVGLAIHRADGGGVSLIDRAGRLVFRYAPPAPYSVGDDWRTHYPPIDRALRGRESTGTVADRTMRGKRRMAAWVPIPAIGFVASAGRLEEPAVSVIRRDLTRDVALVLLVYAVALLVALRVSRSVAIPVRRLEADARRLGAGDLAHRAQTAGPAEVDRLGEALNAMAANLQERLTERGELQAALQTHLVEVEELNERLRRAMAETHHRVKNNLQIISALIDMQLMAGHGEVPASEMERLARHVRGLAAVHDLLTQEARAGGDAELLSVRDALAKLKPLLDTMAGSRELRFHVEEVRLPVRQSTALAVLVNELVSNAAKHGEGAIDLSLSVVESRASLAVRDHGPGFPAGFTAREAANTGLELVQSVGGWDLQGEVEFANAPEGGACVTVRFPVGS